MRLVKNRNLDQVIAGCRKNKSRAQRTLYELLAPRMYAVCIRYTKNKQDAQDVLQEGFVRVFENINKLEENDKLEAWVKRIFVNCALRFLEKNRKFSFTDEDVSSYSHHAVISHQFSPCEYDELLCMITELPEKYSTVFNLYVVDGFSHKEIAQKLEISENTSRSQLNRARVALQQKIKKNELKGSESTGS